MGACFFACRVVGFQSFGGCGALNLKASVGGEAKGTPRNLLTVLNGPEAFGYEAIIPSMFPYFVDTVTDWMRGKKAQKMDNVVRPYDILLLANGFFGGSFANSLLDTAA